MLFWSNLYSKPVHQMVSKTRRKSTKHANSFPFSIDENTWSLRNLESTNLLKHLSLTDSQTSTWHFRLICKLSCNCLRVIDDRYSESTNLLKHLSLTDSQTSTWHFRLICKLSCNCLRVIDDRSETCRRSNSRNFGTKLLESTRRFVCDKTHASRRWKK